MMPRFGGMRVRGNSLWMLGPKRVWTTLIVKSLLGGKRKAPEVVKAPAVMIPQACQACHKPFRPDDEVVWVEPTPDGVRVCDKADPLVLGRLLVHFACLTFTDSPGQVPENAAAAPNAEGTATVGTGHG